MSKSGGSKGGSSDKGNGRSAGKGGMTSPDASRAQSAGARNPSSNPPKPGYTSRPQSPEDKADTGEEYERA